MEKLNKRGFTLVELLSVIVILSVVVLIATNAVLPAANSAKKQALAVEANTIVKLVGPHAAKEGVATSKCYSLRELIDAGVVDKNDEGYHGSFLVSIAENGSVTYKVWLSNGTYMINGVNADVDPEDVKANALDASDTCSLEK